MASPTAIPHPEASAHHQPATPPPNSSSSFSRSPTGTSPNPMVSPIYTSAGRSAFSLPGPNSSSTSPTTTSWYAGGFASNNSQRVRSPTANFVTASSSTVTPQKDYFSESATSPSHFRKASFGSGSRSSSISSADLTNEPTTPKPMEGVGGGGGAPLGRVSSIPMGNSFEQIKGHRGSWGPHSNPGWNGLNSFRAANSNGNNANNPQIVVENGGSTGLPPAGNGMSGLLRKFSFGSGNQPLKSGHLRSTSNAAAPMATSAPPQQTMMPNESAVETTVSVPTTRGRQASVGGGPMGKRRPSPMGERLLMGHFNAH